MQESLIHYIWQFQYFDRMNLRTIAGEEVQVFHPGYRNANAGPDFTNARVKIDGIEWIGNVEIHIRSSGWKQHHHDKDPAYDNVILHVVWKHDNDVIHKDNSSLPTLELQHKVDAALLLRYQSLYSNPETIPCGNLIRGIPDLVRMSMVEKALFTRIESRSENIQRLLKGNKYDWEETCYQLLCRNFGFKVNNEAFFTLGCALPYKAIMKHADKLVQIEAMLFGQAGLLEENIVDPYLEVLKREFVVLSKKFNLAEKQMNKVQWKFLRLRPANFPTIRIAQLAMLIYKTTNVFSHFISAKSYDQIYETLKVEQSDYWLHHYLFNRYIESEIPGLGKMSIDNIIINTVVPVMVAYGKLKDDDVIVENALNILQSTPCEKNMVIGNWNALGVRSRHAFDSQGLIELYTNFCLRRRCLDCNIGSSIVRLR
jgi:hypothetical protein